MLVYISDVLCVDVVVYSRWQCIDKMYRYLDGNGISL